MAYLPNYDDEDQTGQNGIQLANTGATGAGAAKQGTAAYGAQAGGGGPSAPGTSQGQGSFIDFSKYTAANPDAAAATANNLSSQVAGQAAGAQGQIRGIEGQFYADATRGSPFGDPYRAQQAPTLSPADPGHGHQGGGIANGNTSYQSGALQTDNPYGGQYANNPNWAAYLGTLGYTGPNDLTSQSNYGQVSSAAQNAGQGLSALQTQGGRQAMLEQNGGPGYGAGSSRFDAGLAGAAGGEQFNALQSKYGDLPWQLAQANQRAGNRANQLRAFDQSAAQAASAAVPGLQQDATNLSQDNNAVPMRPAANPFSDMSADLNAYQDYLGNGQGWANMDLNKWKAAGRPKSPFKGG